VTTCHCGCDPTVPGGRVCAAGFQLKKEARSRWERWLELKGTIGSTREDRDAAHAEYQEARGKLSAHYEAEESVTP